MKKVFRLSDNDNEILEHLSQMPHINCGWNEPYKSIINAFWKWEAKKMGFKFKSVDDRDRNALKNSGQKQEETKVELPYFWAIEEK